MSVTIPTVYIYNVKDIVTIKSKVVDNVKEKWCEDYLDGLEKENLDYIKRELQL